MGYGNYIITAADSFRIANIQNISNSLSEELLLTHELFLNAQTEPNTSSCSFLNGQMYINYNNGTYTHDPGGTDSDFDSLSFSLVSCANVGNYIMPPSGVINSNSGLFSMTPTTLGTYAVAIRVEQWIPGANPVLTGVTIRDMVIDVTMLAIPSMEIILESLPVYPNPSIGIFTIEAESGQLGIYNTLGELIYSKEITEPQTVIDLSDRAKGIYYLVYRNKKAVSTQKLLIQ